jgi:hypothetical protein
MVLMVNHLVYHLNSCFGIVEFLYTKIMNKEIKKGNLNFDQSGRAYPDNPHIKENWDCIWEKDGKHYKLIGDDEHKEWEEIHTHK